MYIPTHTLNQYTTNSICKILAYKPLLPTDCATLPHRHNSFQIIVVHKGSGSHWIDFEEQAISAPYATVVFPGQIHRLKLSDDAEAEVVLFDETVFCTALLAGELKDYNINLMRRLGHIQSLPTCEHNEIVAMLHAIKRLYADLNMIRKMQIKFMVKVMLLKMIDLAPEGAGEMSHIDENRETYLRFRQLVDLHFEKQRRISYYAELLGISPRKLTDICNAYAQKSPLTIVHERLLLDLSKALVEEAITLKELAYRYGFSSQSALNKFIEQHKGCTPQEWQKNLLGSMMGAIV